MTQAAHTAISTLAAQLPPLPPLQPGEGAQLMSWAASSSASGGGGGGGGGRGGGSGPAAVEAVDEWEWFGPAGRPLAAEPADAPPVTAAAAAAAPPPPPGSLAPPVPVRGAVALWSVAACCLRCLRPDFLTAQVLAAPPAAAAGGGGAAAATAALAALQLRCVLVGSGHVSYRELMAVRSAMTSAAAAGGGGGGGGGGVTTAAAEADALLVPLGLALAATPQAFQVREAPQWRRRRRRQQRQRHRGSTAVCVFLHRALCMFLRCNCAKDPCACHACRTYGISHTPPSCPSLTLCRSTFAPSLQSASPSAPSGLLLPPQVQVLLQTLDGAREAAAAAADPRPHLQLAAALVAVCLAASAGGAGGGSIAASGGAGSAAGAAAAAAAAAAMAASASAAPELVLALTSRAAAVRLLPYSLPRLLSRSPWNSSCEAVAQALLAVARACGVGAVSGGGGGSSGVAEGEALGVVLTCLRALRDAVPPYTYDTIQSTCGWRALAPMAAAAEGTASK